MADLTPAARRALVARLARALLADARERGPRRKIDSGDDCVLTVRYIGRIVRVVSDAVSDATNRSTTTMTTATKTRTARPVYAIPTGTGHVGKSVRVGTATSITGAIEQVRASGFRVMAKGGDIGLQSQTALTGSDEDALVWGVTVYDN